MLYILQDLSSFLKFKTEVFHEPRCSGNSSGFLNPYCVTIESKVWEKHLSLHEAPGAACRSLTWTIHLKAPTWTTPDEANGYELYSSSHTSPAHGADLKTACLRVLYMFGHMGPVGMF